MSDEILTVDTEATKKMIKARHKSLRAYANERGLVKPTFYQLMREGLGSRSALRSDCRYQNYLRIIKHDGLLVELKTEGAA